MAACVPYEKKISKTSWGELMKRISWTEFRQWCESIKISDVELIAEAYGEYSNYVDVNQ